MEFVGVEIIIKDSYKTHCRNPYTRTANKYRSPRKNY